MPRPIHRLALLSVILTVFALVAFPVAAQSPAGKLRERSQIDDKYKWNLADMYPDQASWDADYKLIEKGIPDLAAFKGKVSQSPGDLLKYLTLRDELVVKLEKLLSYASMLSDQDTKEPGPQALEERGRNLAVKWGEATAWFEPEIVSLPEGRLFEWTKGDAKLGVYTHSFDALLRQRKHVLSAREEELMVMASKVGATPSNAFGMLKNADMKFPTVKDEKGNEVQLSEGRYFVMLQSKDLSYKNTFAALYSGAVQGDIFRARAHHYDSALQAAVDPDKVPVEVYDNLISTVHDNLATFHRYMAIRAQKLGVDKLHVYDMFVPLIDAEAPEIGYDDAVAKVITALAPLGPEYLEPMKKGFAGRWIDVYETPNKRSGAYSGGTYNTHPFMLLNYNGTYEDMFTVAHEMGHSMHSWFSTHNQPPVYGDYPIFLAEVASTSNEVILGDYLRKHAKSDQERLFLINMALEGIRGTVINQTMWAEFEKVVHAEAEKGTPLTYETMGKIYRDITKLYYGPNLAYDDELDGYWSRVPHFYRAFYVYKYATSYCASVALARRTLAGEPNALQQYLGFLKSGSSDYPIDILKKAGVDMSTPKPIQETMKMFGELVDEMEALLKKQH